MRAPVVQRPATEGAKFALCTRSRWNQLLRYRTEAWLRQPLKAGPRIRLTDAHNRDARKFCRMYRFIYERLLWKKNPSNLMRPVSIDRLSAKPF
jgi:hypothetical protein